MEDYLGDDNGGGEAYKKILAGAERLNWRTAEIAGRFLERHGRAAEAKALYERFLNENRDNGDLVQPSLARIEAGQIPPATEGGVKDGLAEALFELGTGLTQRETQHVAHITPRPPLEI